MVRAGSGFSIKKVSRMLSNLGCGCSVSGGRHAVLQYLCIALPVVESSLTSHLLRC